MNAFFAFLHHLCFVAIMLAIFAEMLLLKQPLSLASAKRIRLYDAIYGISAGLVLIVGIVRVMYFEKGADYYLHSAPFIAKMVLFLIIGLISIYPTMTFLKWNAALKQGVLPEIGAVQARTLRLLMHIEATLLLLMILCAAMMAKGIGYFGH